MHNGIALSDQARKRGQGAAAIREYRVSAMVSLCSVQAPAAAGTVMREGGG